MSATSKSASFTHTPPPVEERPLWQEGFVVSSDDAKGTYVGRSGDLDAEITMERDEGHWVLVRWGNCAAAAQAA
jgi:hypothetical protein